jgi:hypothetical protein
VTEANKILDLDAIHSDVHLVLQRLKHASDVAYITTTALRKTYFLPTACTIDNIVKMEVSAVATIDNDTIWDEYEFAGKNRSVDGGKYYQMAHNLQEQDILLSDTVFASLDTTTYSNVDVIKTTALSTAKTGTTAIDGFVRVFNSSYNELTEIAQANINLVASIGKFYYHTDNTIWLFLTPDTYATIAAARTGLATYQAYYQLANPVTSKFDITDLGSPIATGAMTIRITFFKSPKTLTTTTDVPELDPQYHNLLKYGLIQALASQGQDPQTGIADYWQAKYDEELAKITKNLQGKFNAAPVGENCPKEVW